MNWSPQQEAVFALFTAPVPAGTAARPGPRNVVVRARAGTGKTTTVVELVKRILAKWSRLRVVCCAFNKEIAKELATRLPAGAEAKTLHALGLAQLSSARKVRVDNDRDMRLAAEACGVNAPKDVVRLVAKLAALGKDCLPLCQSADELTDLQLDFDLLSDDISAVYTDGWIREKAYASIVAAEAFDGTCSFSDMVYLPLRCNLARPLYDLVIVDECQDMNAGQLLLAQRLCKAGGRIVVVGDDCQAIYGFRGADSDALDRLKQELAACETPLTITRRCPKAVVALAKQLVPDFVAADEAPEGLVDFLPLEKLTSTAQPGNFILSRTNAPLVGACLRLAAAGIPARVRGRDIGKGLVQLINKAGAFTLDEVEEYLEKWADKKLARCARMSDERAERLSLEVEDKLEALRALIATVDSVDALIAKLETLFSDDTATGVMLSTVHKAKGLEAERVFLLESSFRRRAEGKDGEEENHIRYVALTRAKHHLTLVR